MNKRYKLILLVLGAPLLAILMLALLVPLLAGPWVDDLARRKITEIGKDRFSSTVTVERVSVSILPPSATLTGIVFRHKGRTDVPPLFRIRQMNISGGMGLFAPTPRASSVRLTGLEIVVPRRKGPKPEKSGEPEPKQRPVGTNFATAEIVADGAKLEVLSKKPGREPLTFDLRRLRLHDVSLDEPMRYDSQLRNPKPPGLIRSTGTFGPWNGEEPSLTPVQGEYLFTDADLSDFKGISGILRSEGKFDGVLEEIVVDGTAEIPQFKLNISDNPVDLHTQYHAIVDGTNGDTRLEPVHAQFLHSKIVAEGAVEGEEGKKGKAVRLQVNVSEARIEDMLTLAMRGKKPLLAGPIRFQTKFDLPTGDRDVVDKLMLDGHFSIDDGRFQKNALQDKVDSLSRKGQGEPRNTDVDNVTSDLSGRFSLKDGFIRFQQLKFQVEGASVSIDGAYGLRNEDLDFQGELRLDAKVSETTTGFKAVLLKAVDPLFSRKTQGKTQSVLPIKISGTRSKPQFGLDIAKALNPKH
ncbi:MAG: AsmA-like C-terminal region-containing protein [Acidobacteriota bacterium]